MIDHATNLLFNVKEPLRARDFLMSHGFARAEDAEPVTTVSGDAAFAEIERTRIAGADVGNQCVRLRDARIVLQQPQRGLINQARHVAVINQLHTTPASDLHSI